MLSKTVSASMTNRVVLDTSLLVALVDARDKWHDAAMAIKAALKTSEAGLVYLDPVINETISVLARRLQEQRRVERFESLLDKVEELAAFRTDYLGISYDTAPVSRDHSPGT